MRPLYLGGKVLICIRATVMCWYRRTPRQPEVGTREVSPIALPENGG